VYQAIYEVFAIRGVRASVRQGRDTLSESLGNTKSLLKGKKLQVLFSRVM
jgi:hypothetical protein